MNEEIKIVVATICFGMGVNKKNIRFVINIGVSLSA
jgi:superfamily II DNA helicase RecQ